MAAQPEVQNGGGEAEKVVLAPAVEITAVFAQLNVAAPKADDAVQFYKAAFGAVELERATDLKRKADQEHPFILAAKLKVGSSTFLVSDQVVDAAGEPVKAAGGYGGTALVLQAEDVEAAVAKAVQAGAVAEGEITTGGLLDAEQRVGKVKDPFGFVWIITGGPAKSGEPIAAPITV